MSEDEARYHESPTFVEVLSRLAHEIRESRKASVATLKWFQDQGNSDFTEKQLKRFAELKGSIENAIQRTEDKIMASQAEAAQTLRDNTAKLNNIGADIDDLVQKVTVLEQALKNQDNATPELEAAVKVFVDQLEVVDAKYPKLTAPPTEPPVEQPPTGTTNRR